MSGTLPSEGVGAGRRPTKDTDPQTSSDAVPLDTLADAGPDGRRQHWDALRAALRQGLLTTGDLDVAELLRRAAEPGQSAEPADGREVEWQALEQLGRQVDAAGQAGLRP